MAIAHFPTLILIVGYISFWLELYFIKQGRGMVSPLAYILSAVLLVLAIFNKRHKITAFFISCINEAKKQNRFIKYMILGSLVIIFCILIVTFLALLKPPHSPQEFDALNYHLALPRQHLIRGTFSHIEWSSADLFPLPLQFALAPYWLVSEVPSRLIQIFFVFGLLGIAASIAILLSKGNFISVYLAIMAIMGSHAVGIQMPVLMLDLVMAYLFIASIDSFLKKSYSLAGIEFSFLFWAKSFNPVLFLSIFLFLYISYIIARIFKIKQLSFGFGPPYPDAVYKKTLEKTFLIFIIASIAVGGPFVLKSIYCSGTPLFPFSPGILKVSQIDQTSPHWQSIEQSSKVLFSVKDNYGSGRDVINLLRHFWLIAVPETSMGGLMNRYDYPLGLPYLLFICPFFYFLAGSIKKKEFSILPLFAAFYWASWWMGSQQARFLYIPLLIIFITVAAKINTPPKILIIALFCALLLNSLSIYRAHAREIKLTSKELIRQQDNKLMELNKEYYASHKDGPLVLERFDIAYALFPAEVRLKGKNYWWVLEE